MIRRLLLATFVLLTISTVAAAQTATPTITNTPTITPTVTPTQAAHCSTSLCAMSAGTITLTADFDGDCTTYALAGIGFGDLFVMYPPAGSGALGKAWYERILTNNNVELCGEAATVTGEVWRYFWIDRTSPSE